MRVAHPTAGVYEAADFQWWWRIPRKTDDVPQLFWFDESGQPVAGAIATDWEEAVALDPILMPDADRDSVAQVVERGLVHTDELGFENVDFANFASAGERNGFSLIAWYCSEDPVP